MCVGPPRPDLTPDELQALRAEDVAFVAIGDAFFYAEGCAKEPGDVVAPAVVVALLGLVQWHASNPLAIEMQADVGLQVEIKMQQGAVRLTPRRAIYACREFGELVSVYPRSRNAD